jgi:hypothetical protein
MIGFGKLLLRDYGEKPESAVLRTEMESGFAKQAKIRSLVPVFRPVIMDYSNDEYTTFKTWFKDTLARGTNWFEWTDPQDGASKQARIVRGEIESRSYNATEGDELRWEVSFLLETME